MKNASCKMFCREKKNKLIYLCKTVVFALKDNIKTGGTIFKESKHDVPSIGSTPHINVQFARAGHCH
jgi:hypothetical protein